MNVRRSRLNPIRLKKKVERSFGFQGPLPAISLNYKASTEEEYSFENGKIQINGMDVLSLIDAHGMDVELLACLSGAIDEYRRVVWERYGTRYRAFNAQSQAILEKLLGKMGKAYEELNGGIRVLQQGGRLWINDIDPKVVLSLFLSHPTEERRRYLKSMEIKLALILEGKAGRAHTHGVLEEAKRLFVQIRTVLENTASADSAPLLAAVNHLAR